MQAQSKSTSIGMLSDKAYNWIISQGPKIVAGIIILFVGLWLIKLLLKWLHNGLHQKEVNSSVRTFLLSLLGVALRVLLLLGVMQVVGISMTIFAAVVASFGVAVGLALSGTLQNFASGILILLLKPFYVGDNIITQGLEGTVTSIQIFYTLVKTFDNRMVIVPNGKLSNEVIINISREGIRRLDIEIKVPNNVDFKQVKSVVNSTIDGHEECLKIPERRIGISAMEFDGYKIGINVWVNAHGFYDTRLKLQEVLMEDIKAADIKLTGM
ncbi:mechanosensitive ion channel domain-containing protein [Mucilaginibacter sp.]|uniref:mechanosensitive ion channel family protein n=1 Tax=Mucilaginibacter sp. TaxID=1882438 RepID=UPI0026333A7B|nr:mechanosensitive ion channel domain-containing protein [Mucilaginibacter sp.]MDB4924265.1 mechanosensitive ion channel family protein [Mucilaginibacter sp.]